MNYILTLIFGLSILISGALAVFRYREINRIYYPVIWCIWCACITEITGFTLSFYGLNNYWINNIYTLAEAVLLATFFRRCGLFKKRSTYIFIIACYCVLWLFDNLIFGVLYVNSVYFRIIYAFSIVLMSITAMNKLLFSGIKHLFTNSSLLLYIAFIIYFTYKILIEAFWLYGVSASPVVFSKIYDILDYVNLLCNLIYAIAVLWMKKKLAFTLSS